MKEVSAMRRISIVAFLLALSMILCACDGNSPTVSTGDNSSDTTVQTTSSSQDTSSEDVPVENPADHPNYTKEYTVLQKPASEKNAMKRVKILVMGDSYTSGDGTPSAYRHALFTTLYENGGHFEFVGPTKSSDIRLSDAYQAHMAAGGRTTPQLQTSYENNVKGGKLDYDIALILIGGNDYYGGISADELFERFKSLLDVMVEDRPDAYIFFSEMCEYGGIVKSKIDDVNAKLKTLIDGYKAEGKKVEYVDLDEYVTFTAAEDLMNAPPSGSHPNQQGNNKLGYAYGEAMIDTVLELNKQPAVKGQAAFVDPTGIKASKNEMTLKIDEQGSAYYTISPAESDVKTAIWSSSNPYVASVNEYGIVTAHKAGEVVITARAAGTNLKAEVKVTVTDEKFELVPAGAQEVLYENFDSASNWSGTTNMIANGRAGKYYVDKLTLTSKKGYTVSKDAGSITFYTLTSGHLGKNNDYYQCTFAIGGYELRLMRNMQKIVLLCDQKIIGTYEGDPYTFPKDKFVINFVDGKVYVYRNNELLISGDAPHDAKGAFVFKSYFGGTFLFDELVLKSGK